MPVLPFGPNRNCAIVIVLDSRLQTYPRAQRLLAIAAWLVCGLLLLRFAVDFDAQGPILAVPFWGLVALAVGVMGVNAFSAPKPPDCDKDKAGNRRMRALLLSFIPLAFLASSLECTGLSLHGCSPFCTFIKLGWIPLITAACLLYHITGDGRGPAVLSIMSFVPLFPHCVCYNVANAWWIDYIGASPECYIWGSVISGLAVWSLAAGQRYLITLVVSALIIVGSLGFFVAHHYFSFPW